MPDPLRGTLGLCRRAGRLAMGFDAAVDSVIRGDAALVLAASDCSERTLRNIRRIAEENDVNIRALPLTIDEVGFAVAKRVGILAVCDGGFAKKITELLEKGAAEGMQSAKAGEELH